nr:reverse transcriptase domain-containing protein [Tanacetum cinerariifolium]
MSALANITPIISTVKNASVKEKTLKETNAVPKASILDFCEEHYEDILPIILDRARHDKRKEVQTRLDFGESPKKKAAPVTKDTGNQGQKGASHKEDLSVPWTCEDVDPFTPRICNFKSLRKTRMPNNVKTYDGTGDPKDHLKIFQAVAQVERWAMPTWCHMFNSTLIGAVRVWFDELPPESIDGYKGLKAAFLAYFMQQKKYVKDPVEIHNIKQRDGETIEEFIERFKIETGRMKGAPETPKEIFAAELGKFKPPPPMLRKQIEELRVTRQKVTQSFAHVKEITFPPLTANKETEGPLVIEAEIGGHAVHRIYVDGGSSMEVLYEHCFNRLRPENKSQMVPATTSLNGFSEETIWPLGQLRLLVTIGDTEHYTKAWMNFMIVRSPSPYNGILGRHGIREIQAVPSTAHGMLKFSVNGEIVTIRSTILTPTECATIAATPKESAKKRLKHITKFLKWPYTLTFWTKRLLLEEWIFPCQTEKRGQALERANTIQVEVQKLVEAGILREVYYHDWLSNPVMVRKHDGRWRMCLDFTDLNKAYAYKGYHQIQMVEQDEKKTAFHTSHEAFDRRIGRNLEIYVDDLVIKSHTETKLLRDKKKRYGHSPDTDLFREPSAASSRAKLYPNEKASPDASLRSQKVVQILPGASHWEHNITYRSRTSVKGQILADFLVEKLNDAPPEASVIETSQEPWTLFTDESSCVDGSGAGLILTSLDGTGFTYALRFQFTASNNEAEYEALIAGLRIATQVPRSKNKKADALSKIALTNFAHLSKQVLVEVLKEKSIQEREMATVVEEEGPTWMTPIIEYLRDETLPDNRKEARKLRIKARQYELLEGILYRRSFLKPWLRCIGPLQADYVIRKIHEGSCSMHAGPRSVVAKAMRSGYYWPTMHRDAREMIRKCKDCQIHRPMPGHPQQPLTPITAPWPFYKWGIDIAGPFPEGLGKVKFLIFAMDYFTKWIKTKSVATITSSQVKKFVWNNIVCHFGLPGEIVSDNVKHPQSNGLVERENKSLGEGIKARLGEGNKNWQEELPHVLWAHRMMIKSNNDDTLFSLTYETEAVIPAEIGMPTYRTTRAAIREAKAKLKMTKYYNARVRGVTFRPEDFDYRSNDASHTVDGGKLGPKWEGPYEVAEALGDGAYKLRSTDRTILSRTWNIAILKKCYL